MEEKDDSLEYQNFKIATPHFDLQPPAQASPKVSWFYYVMILIAFLMISLTLTYLAFEWTGQPLPPYLKLTQVISV